MDRRQGSDENSETAKNDKHNIIINELCLNFFSMLKCIKLYLTAWKITEWSTTLFYRTKQPNLHYCSMSGFSWMHRKHQQIRKYCTLYISLMYVSSESEYQVTSCTIISLIIQYLIRVHRLTVKWIFMQHCLSFLVPCQKIL